MEIGKNSDFSSSTDHSDIGNVNSNNTNNLKSNDDLKVKKKGNRISRLVSAGPKAATNRASSILSNMKTRRMSVRPPANTSQIPFDVDVLQRFDADAQNNLHSVVRGEVLEATFRMDDREVGKEVVNRTNVMTILLKSHEDRIESLKQHISQNPNDEVAHAQLKLTEDNLVQVKSTIASGATWAASASYRRLLETVPLEEAHQKFLPACVNLRTQVVEQKGEITSNINRSGAVHDYRTGSTSLPALKQLKAELKSYNDLEQITPNQWKMLEGAFGISKKTSSAPLDELKKKIDFTIVERHWVLENQALQDFAAHLSSHSPESLKLFLAENDKVSFSRVSMLDAMKPPKREGDFVINEANQMLDMQDIYATFDGKELVFDGKGPFMDLDGKIHLPVSISDDEGKAISKTLDVVFFNISAQGNTENKGPQRSINEQAIEKMRPLIEAKSEKLYASGQLNEALDMMQRFENLENTLGKESKGGFDTAEQAAMLLLDLDALLSINCFSGKDRTGLLAALITFNKLKVSVDAEGVTGSRARAILAQWGRDLMSENGNACRVVEDNTGFRALKLAVDARVRILSQGGARERVMGTSKRVSNLGKAISTFVLPPGPTGEAQWVAAA
ncbi:MAG: hypothetical protein Q8K75_02005 [Chlamydiales bacterium]|nr:hypothetical protein [Chlamydiales bacterium]